nr:response regulator transcription factor [uncultured Devosia sp.]
MRVLVVEDETKLRSNIVEALGEAGFAAEGVADGAEAEFLGQTESYDAVVLDLGLPGMDGIAVLEAWRKAGKAMPVLILTAREEWGEKVRGFRAGADDYLTKPFLMDEVVIRLRSLIRRAAGHAQPILTLGNLSLDTQMGLFTRDGMPLKLTAFEYRILAYFMHRPGQVVSRSELSEHVYDRNADRDYNSIEVVISRLRKKLTGASIETVRGEGYRLMADAA